MAVPRRPLVFAEDRESRQRGVWERKPAAPGAQSLVPTCPSTPETPEGLTTGPFPQPPHRPGVSWPLAGRGAWAGQPGGVAGQNHRRAWSWGPARAPRCICGVPTPRLTVFTDTGIVRVRRGHEEGALIRRDWGPREKRKGEPLHHVWAPWGAAACSGEEGPPHTQPATRSVWGAWPPALWEVDVRP